MDILTLLAAGTAELLSAPAAGLSREPVIVLVVFPAVAIAILAMRGTYRPYVAPSFLDDIRSIVSATALAAMAITFFRVLLGDDPDAASHAVREWVFAVAYMSGGRGAEYLYRNRVSARQRPTLIIGAGRVGRQIAERLATRPESGLLPIGFVDDEPLEGVPGALPVLGTRENLEALVEEWDIEHAIISFSTASHDVELRDVATLRRLGVAVSIVPRLFEGVPDRVVAERLVGYPIASTFPSNPRGWQVSLKYAMDRVIAGALIVLASPVLLVIAIGTLLSVGRPILFRQRRVGRDGQSFEMLKFRTMRGSPDVHGESDAGWAAAIAAGAETSVTPLAVDRTTPFGGFLRRLGLDELPQLFNVVRGEMSIVGPRPEREGYVRTFAPGIYRYDDRHRVKAGITGWAQVHGLRGETSLADRVEWDNAYIENWSLWLDLKIVLMTTLEIFRGSRREA